jgi:hypothetical protein
MQRTNTPHTIMNNGGNYPNVKRHERPDHGTKERLELGLAENSRKEGE